MKNERQERILQLIREKDIETQEQLLQALSESGFRTTQATISRDIKQLRLVKRTGPGGVRYELPQKETAPQ
ncbi:MAG: arginine repressor, partial [Oscillospiraceae bacterium]|nr:arginine repressor [Oscillospiraceae bacterium]